MPTSSGRVPPRARTAVTLAVAVVLSYGAGLVTGVIGSAPPANSSESAGVLDEAADQIAAHAVTPIDRSALNAAAMHGMLGALDDRWSSYYAPEDFDSFSQALEGRYTGVGIWVRQAGGKVLVSSVTPASPAAVAGVHAADVLVSVDGLPTDGASVATVASSLRGTPGSVVTLGLTRAGEPRTVKIERATVTTHDVTVDRLSGGITVIRVAAFTRGVGAQVKDAVAHAGAGSGVVLDLRGDPGGLLEEAVSVSSAFLDGGKVVSYERRGAGTAELDATSGGNVTVPLVVLVDGSTASAAEVVTGALQDRGRAVVVGATTFGKGSVQEPSHLSDGSAIEITVGRYLTPAGRSIDGSGIEPDVVVEHSKDKAVAERRAVEVLAGLQASVDTSGRG